MPYVFLTGATGLLGRYLIKDLSLAGVPMVVLVRPSRRATAQHRVENVMCYWDKILGRSLPRPVVLEGDITEPDLGLGQPPAPQLLGEVRRRPVDAQEPALSSVRRTGSGRPRRTASCARRCR